MNLKKYEATNITPPLGTEGPGIYSVYDPENGINGYVENGVLYNMKPEEEQHIQKNLKARSWFRDYIPAATKLPERGGRMWIFLVAPFAFYIAIVLLASMFKHEANDETSQQKNQTTTLAISGRQEILNALQRVQEHPELDNTEVLVDGNWENVKDDPVDYRTYSDQK